MSYEQIISSGLYVRLKELVHSLAEHFQALVNKLHNLNVNSLKMPPKTIAGRKKRHHGPHAARVFETLAQVYVFGHHDRMDLIFFRSFKKAFGP